MVHDIQECWFYHGTSGGGVGWRPTVSLYGVPNDGDDWENNETPAPFGLDWSFWHGTDTKDIVNDDRYHPAIRITFNSPTISKLMEEIDEYVTNTNPKNGLHRSHDCDTWWFRPWWNPESNSFEEIFFHRVE